MSFTLEVVSAVSVTRMFKAAVLDWHNLSPKIVPETIVSGAIIEGDGGVRSVRQINFTPAFPFSYLKERFDLIDKENLDFKSTVIEGFYLGKKLKSATAHYKFQQTSTGGSISRVVACFEVLPVVDAAAELTKAKESTEALLRAVESYLLSNPSAYAD